MAHSFTSRKRIRNSFGTAGSVAMLPNLIEIQKQSYDTFLNIHASDEEREQSGLANVFRTVFPVEDHAGTATIEYVSHAFDAPKYDVEECIQRDLSYGAPLRVTLRLIAWDVDEEAGTREIQSIKEQEVYFGEISLMTDKGTFIVNGTERVIVSQMHRSPGVFFDHDRGKTHSSGKLLFSARVIPYRGSWLDFEFDHKEILNFRIDRKRKQHVTTLLQALGLSVNDIIDTFYSTEKLSKKTQGWAKTFDAEAFVGGITLSSDLIDSKGKVIVEAGNKITPRKAKKLAEEGLKEVLLSEEDVQKQYVAEDITNKDTGEVIAAAGTPVTPAVLEYLQESGAKTLQVIHLNTGAEPYILNALAVDKNRSQEDALIDIYKVMRPGEPPTVEAAEAIFNNLFFSDAKYDLSDVGRMKLNSRLGLEGNEELGTLTRDDILGVIHTIINIKDGKGEIDDIDHLGNRRVRSVGELAENQFRIGLLRVERSILERVASVEVDTVMPQDMINAKPLMAVMKEFFGSSQLSQFMDQTNPLSEVTHKRRLSALGPGGLTRERAGFEVRDVHQTHYGRICPIETPEGPNIGLINSLASYARVNQYGFIETPYRKVENGVVTDTVEYVSAIDEGKFIIAQNDAEVDGKGKLVADLVACRQAGELLMAKASDVQYADVSPQQLVSVASALIPFLENDDANRALMGSNMMRQAVPLVRTEAPLVGTGMESVVAKDSRAAVVAEADGVVKEVDARRIVVQNTGKSKSASGVKIYSLSKFQRSNQNTCINQRPIVKVGDKIKEGDVIADGPSTSLGELALGQNVLAAFMPWNGYNFEDSILISERLVRDDVFTSIHIEEFEITARDTKLGPEDITRDIPNVGEENLRSLDETGIVHVGAEVGPGDILVGKVTPKSESPMTPEEKLLRAIFGEKAADVRDSSLRMKPGITGTVVEVRIFSRRGLDKDERAMAIEREEVARLRQDHADELKILSENIFVNLQKTLDGQEVTKAYEGLKKGGKLDKTWFTETPTAKWWGTPVKDAKVQDAVEALEAEYNSIKKQLDDQLNDKIEKVQSGDDLPSGVLKMVKVFVAVKRKLQPGDKMAGRHGNKGVISRICPVEDMPYLEDGTPVDLVLNPLGVPSRMNVGQILETHLGWASKGIGQQVTGMLDELKKAEKPDTTKLQKSLGDIYQNKEDKDEVAAMNADEVMELAGNLTAGVPMATPVFDGISAEEIGNYLSQAGLAASGQSTLYDGRTGEKFDRPVTVGIIYMLKLHHLVDEKIHARSIGPYSLVTQQPLGGKSHFGGQRFGEMECWALQAYGASYTLQELLTVKSDDVAGRTKVYESIVKGDHTFESGLPESFHVMVKELRSLCLNVELRQFKDSANDDATAALTAPEAPAAETDGTEEAA